MLRKLVIPFLGAVLACSDYSENSATCGILTFAGATKVLQFLDENPHASLTSPPGNLGQSVLTRVVGYGSSRALAGLTDQGAVLGYEGEGFPQIPGFGLVLVDDSSEAVRGVMVYETEPPQGYPQIGTISDRSATLPLYGVRINWSVVSDPKCPLLREPEESDGD